MNDCCSSTKCSSVQSDKHICPGNKKSYRSIPVRTVLHHVKHPWALHATDKTFYFCDDPECEVVYFCNDNSVITTAGLRTAVGIKSAIASSLLCYCFGVSKADLIKNAALKEFVIEQTKQGLCSCETTNPSGRCCLKDFPK